MKENKKKIVKALTEKHIEIIKLAKLSNINGGEGCDVILDGPN